MWKHNFLSIALESREVVTVEYRAKVYDAGSEYGINGGPISKLWVALDGVCILNYDRGWDLYPYCEAGKLALAILLGKYKEESK